MDNTLYVGLSRQMTLRREFDLVANNIANADTVGFKVESLMVSAEPESPKGGAFTGDPRPVNFVLDKGVARDFGQGSLKPTGGPLDVAISGDGFFQVNTAQGTRYTRDGRFAMDDSGRLVTQAGDAVAGEGGAEIVIDPKNGPLLIAGDGTISQANGPIGRLAVMRFADMSGLSKAGGSLFQNVSNLQPEQANDAKVTQGMLEGSNVQPISQMTRLIEISRAYEQAAKMMEQTGDMNTQAVQRLGRVN